MFQSLILFVYKIVFMAAETPPEDTQENSAVDPIYEMVTTLGPAFIGLVLLAGIIYSVVLGVAYSKAESGEERDNAKKKMINAIVGFIVVLILISVLYAIRGPIIDMMS